MSLQASSGTVRGGRHLLVGSQGIHADPELLCRPGANESGAVELCVTDGFSVEVAFAQDEEVSGRVVVGGGITGDGSVAEREDVSPAVDCRVVGDIDPALVILMEALMLLQPCDDPAVIG